MQKKYRVKKGYREHLRDVHAWAEERQLDYQCDQAILKDNKEWSYDQESNRQTIPKTKGNSPSASDRPLGDADIP